MFLQVDIDRNGSESSPLPSENDIQPSGRVDIIGKGLITSMKKYYVEEVMNIKCWPKATKRRRDNPDM